MIRRKITNTTCNVVSPEGETLGQASYLGKISPARLARVARRLYDNQLATITDYEVTQDTYEMEEETFLKYATKIEKE